MRPLGLTSLASVAILALSLPAISACGLVPTPTPQVIVNTVEVEVTRLVPVTTTPEPTPRPTATPPIILAEDFEGGAGDWYVASDAVGSSMVARGRLLVTLNQPNQSYFTGHPDLDYLNAPFDLTVTMTNEGDPRDAYGAVEFRYYDNNNYADVCINGDGFVSLGESLDGEYYIIVPWARPSVSVRQPYVLRLIDSGRRVAAYFNGELVFDIPFEDLRPGGVSFFVGTFDDAPSSWGFDDLLVGQFAP
jgi:hypothetical protein